MLKFLTHKLRTHSLNEENVTEKVGVVDRGSYPLAPTRYPLAVSRHTARRRRSRRHQKMAASSRGAIATATENKGAERRARWPGPARPGLHPGLVSPGCCVCVCVVCAMADAGRIDRLFEAFIFCRWRSGTPAPSPTTRRTAPTRVSVSFRPGQVTPGRPGTGTNSRSYLYYSLPRYNEYLLYIVADRGTLIERRFYRKQ